MNNIRLLLFCTLIGLVVPAGPATGTTPLLLNRSVSADSRAFFYRPPAHTNGGPRKKERVRRVDKGPEGEPALPESPPNPVAAALTGGPNGFRGRRKLRLNNRG